MTAARSFWREGDNMSGRNLSHENFDGVKFEGQDLSNSNFYNASFRNASFKNCNFEGSSFAGADLTECDFYESNFTGVDLTAAVVSFGTHLPHDCDWFIYREVIHNGPIIARLERKAKAVCSCETPKAVETTVREYGEVLAELDRVAAELTKTISNFLYAAADILVERNKLGKGN